MLHKHSQFFFVDPDAGSGNCVLQVQVWPLPQDAVKGLNDLIDGVIDAYMADREHFAATPEPVASRQVPPVISDAKAFLAGRALVSAAEFRALTGDSHSGFYKKLRNGQLPAPALRTGPRYTRWKAADVAAYLSDPQGFVNATSDAAQVRTVADVLQQFQLSSATLRRKIRAGQFPEPFKILGTRRLGWLQSTLDAYANSQVQRNCTSADAGL